MIELTMELCDHTKKISGSDTMVLDDQKRHPGKKSEHNSLYSGKLNSCGNRQWVIIDFLSTGSKKAD